MPSVTAYAHGQFNWVDLMSSDPASSKEFYGQLFGWSSEDKPTDTGPPYTVFQLGEDEICGMCPLPPDLQQQGVPPCWNSYINVDELDASLAQVEGLGGSITMPPMDAMDAGRMAGVTDPTGGHFFLWQKNRHPGATKVNDVGCFSWNELATRELEKAREFYGRLLDWTFEENPHAKSKYYIIHNRGQMNGGMIEMTDEWDAHIPPHWSVYFTVANADAACARLVELGGNVRVAPFDIEIGKIAVVNDPQQATFQFFESGEQARM